MALAIVTGANRGLGLQVCRDLIARQYDVVLAVRDVAQGQSAASELGTAARVTVLPLDVSDVASIATFGAALGDLPLVDSLVNNAGASFDGFDATVARRTLDTNYLGAVRVTHAVLPRLAQSANIVMVSSGMGELSHFSKALRARLSSNRLDEAGVEHIAEEFVAAVGRGDHAKLGFPSNAYGLSKALLNAFTRVFSRQLAGSGRRINSVCPGWVRTRMGGNSAPRGVEQGARGITWAATVGDDGPNGGFFRDKRAVPW
ncbi:MAG: SDR family NAD(P)-dependent oxidoreductase [Polyangiaceae bacterium]